MGTKPDNARLLILHVGRAVYHELLLTNFESLEPKLFHQLAEGFAKRMSKDERYKLNVCRDEAERKGIELPEWEGKDIELVGTWMVDQLATLGMLSIKTRQQAGKVRVMESAMCPETITLIDSIREMVVENSRTSCRASSRLRIGLVTMRADGTPTRCAG